MECSQYSKIEILKFVFFRYLEKMNWLQKRHKISGKTENRHKISVAWILTTSVACKPRIVEKNVDERLMTVKRISNFHSKYPSYIEKLFLKHFFAHNIFFGLPTNFLIKILSIFSKFDHFRVFWHCLMISVTFSAAPGTNHRPPWTTYFRWATPGTRIPTCLSAIATSIPATFTHPKPSQRTRPSPRHASWSRACWPNGITSSPFQSCQIWRRDY